jgi:hypothetical protein
MFRGKLGFHDLMRNTRARIIDTSLNLFTELGIIGGSFMRSFQGFGAIGSPGCIDDVGSIVRRIHIDTGNTNVL